VKGRASGLQNIAEPVRLALLGTRTGLRIEASPASNGSFEFPRVPPDSYTLVTIPRLSLVTPQTGIVVGRESPFLNVAIPKQHLLAVRLKDDLPLVGSLVLTLNQTEAYTVLLSVPFVLRTAGEMVCVVDVCSTSYERFRGSPMIVSISPDHKSIVLSLPEAEYRVQRNGLPSDLEVKSLSGGSVNLVQDSLVVGSTSDDDRK